MKIRKLTQNDIKAAQEIADLYWNGQPFKDRFLLRLQQYLGRDAEIIESNLHFFVAEDNGEIVGIVGFRKIPQHMEEFAKTANPAELYILAAKNKGKGIGRALVDKVLELTKSLNFTEILIYSGEKHKDAWGLYDHLGFKKISATTAPDSEPGFVWQMIFNK
jgi:GNAT superfamily N-acetyltransferase